MEPNSTDAVIGVKLMHWAAAFVGAICSLSFMAEMSIVARVSSLVVGFAAAIFIGPGIAELVGASERVTAFVVFLIGLLSMAIIPAMQATAAKIPSDIWDLVRERFGGGKR